MNTFYSNSKIYQNKASYKEYLRSEHWQNIRAKIYRSRPNCSVCGRKTWLNIHHKTYKRLGRERMSDLVILCKFCHTSEHKQGGLLKWAKTKQKKIPRTQGLFFQFTQSYKKALKTMDFSTLDNIEKNISPLSLDFSQQRQYAVIRKKLRNTKNVLKPELTCTALGTAILAGYKRRGQARIRTP